MLTCNHGSEWRKWDLHIHSNASDGNSTPHDIVNKSIEMGLSVIALTDHHTFKNIDELKLIASDKGLKVISGVEFRTEYGEQSVHMIGLFPDYHNKIVLDQKALTENILNKLDLTESIIISKGREGSPQLGPEAAFKKGIFKVQVNFKDAADLIHKFGGIVTVHAGDKSNSLEGMKHEGNGVTNVTNLADSLGPLKEELLNHYVDICEVNKGNESSFYLDTFLKPSIIASDAHKTEEIGSKFAWIKADPTFCGLQQVICEPKDRVRIQEDKPEVKADYSTIDRVEIENLDFSMNGTHTQILIHPNLTCIIGGKSTGKSLLINNIAYAIDSEQVSQKYMTSKSGGKKERDNDFRSISGFRVVWSDGSVSIPNNSVNKKIVYIPQTYLNRLSDEREETTEIDKLIEEILLQDHLIKNAHEKMEENNKMIKVDIDKTIYDFIECTQKLSLLNKSLLENNSSAVISLEIAKLEIQKAKLDLGEGVTQADSDNYAIWCNDLKRAEIDRVNIADDFGIIQSIESIDIQVPVVIQNLKSNVKILANSILSKLQDELNKEWIQKRDYLVAQEKSFAEQRDSAISDLKSKIDLIRPLIEKNSSLLVYTEKINKEKDKLVIAKNIENDIEMLNAQMFILLDKMVLSVEKYRNSIQDYADFVNQQKNLNVEGLEFRLEAVFRLEFFMKRLLEFLNNKALSRFKYCNLSNFGESLYTTDFIKNLIISVQKNDSTSLEIKNQFTFEMFLRDILANWYNLNYVVIMDNDKIDDMSPGKKALVLLKLLLELTQSDCPMLIDQPEDDLDNRSIFEDLVKYIKIKKVERQIIIVTHNANIVVGADSEEVIVANQDGQNTKNEAFKFEYRSGSIEDQTKDINSRFILSKFGVQEHICGILEGGEKAFDLRKQKYFFIPN